MADAKFTKAEIVAWSEEAGRRLTPELLSKVPLTEQQRARVKQLRAEAEERLKNHKGILNTLTSNEIREITAEPFGPAKQIGKREDEW